MIRSRLSYVVHSLCRSGFRSSAVQLAGSDRGGKKRRVVKLEESEVQRFFDVGSFNTEMNTELEKLREQYNDQLSPRNLLRAFETLAVKVPGGHDPVPLNSIAQISFKNPRVAVINLAAFPQATKGVLQSISSSGLDVGCQQEGHVIYVPLPRPSREKRENLAKNSKLLYNQCHERLRKIMRSYELKLRGKELKIPKEVYTSLIFYLEDAVRSYAHKGEEMMVAKQRELLTEIQ